VLDGAVLALVERYASALEKSRRPALARITQGTLEAIVPTSARRTTGHPSGVMMPKRRASTPIFDASGCRPCAPWRSSAAEVSEIKELALRSPEPRAPSVQGGFESFRGESALSFKTWQETPEKNEAQTSTSWRARCRSDRPPRLSETSAGCPIGRWSTCAIGASERGLAAKPVRDAAGARARVHPPASCSPSRRVARLVASPPLERAWRALRELFVEHRANCARSFGAAAGA